MGVFQMEVDPNDCLLSTSGGREDADGSPRSPPRPWRKSSCKRDRRYIRAGPEFQDADYATRLGQLRYTAWRQDVGAARNSQDAQKCKPSFGVRGGRVITRYNARDLEARADHGPRASTSLVKRSCWNDGCSPRARVRLVSLSGRTVLVRTDTPPVVGSSVLGRTSQPRVGSGERRLSKFVGLHDEQTVGSGFLVSAKEKAPHQERHAGADPWGQKSRCFGRGDNSVGLSTSYRGAVGPRGSRNGPKDRARPLSVWCGWVSRLLHHTLM